MAGGNFGGGDGTIAQPYLVEDAADFNAVRNNLTAHFRQTKNINMSSFAQIDGTFSGVYDGGNYALSNISISTTAQRQGVFSVVSGSLSNMIIDNLSILIGGTGSTGGIAGECLGSAAFKGCKVSGRIIGKLTVGGFVGFSQGAPVFINCHTDVQITSGDGSNSASTGGFFGRIDRPNVSYCTSRGSISCRGGNVGGFVSHSTTGPASFSACSSSVSIITSPAGYSAEGVGGFVGRLDYVGTFLNCYSTGNISAPGMKGVGGFVGQSLRTSKFSHCYSSGNVYGFTEVGGFVGNNNTSNAPDFINCFSLASEVAVDGESPSPSMGNFAGISYQNQIIPGTLALNTTNFVVR